MASPLQQERVIRPVERMAVAPSAAPRKLRTWSPPRLRHHGDLRGLTLGPSPGLGESGNPAVFRVDTTP